MRTLLLLRHAKSSWDQPALADRARPLAPRGERAARRLALHLDEEHAQLDLVLCSSARRAVQTLDALRLVLGDPMEVQVEDWLYGADWRAIVGYLRNVDPSASTVMVIGHNPGLEDLAVELAGDGDRAALQQLHTKFPTAALAVLDLGGNEWARLAPGQAYLTELVLPRQLSD